jgi:hypothetical protein
MNTVNCITTQTQTQTAAPAQISISFVTLAYGWGYEDGQNGNCRQPWAYWTLSDPRYEEYSEGYDAGQAAAQARQ